MAKALGIALFCKSQAWGFSISYKNATQNMRGNLFAVPCRGLWEKVIYCCRLCCKWGLVSVPWRGACGKRVDTITRQVTMELVFPSPSGELAGKALENGIHCMRTL